MTRDTLDVVDWLENDPESPYRLELTRIVGTCQMAGGQMAVLIAHGRTLVRNLGCIPVPMISVKRDREFDGSTAVMSPPQGGA